MSIDYFPVRLTPLAALLHANLRADTGQTLPTYLAVARTPGPNWKSYDEIAEALQPYAAGRTLNRVSLKTFTESIFNIPATRYVTVGDKPVAMPKQVGEDAVERYINALDTRMIDINQVQDAARADGDVSGDGNEQ